MVAITTRKTKTNNTKDYRHTKKKIAITLTYQIATI